ncbi:MAG: energy transducer TonB [Rhizomicrobium sp.]
MRQLVIMAAACVFTAARAAAADAASAPTVVSVAPKEERACSAHGIIPPTPIGAHAVSKGDYPAIARRLGEQGNVVVTFLIREDGTVFDPIIVRSSGSPRLDEATADLVTHWRYNPATQGGTAVSCRQRAMLSWRLTDTENIVDGEPRFLPPELQGAQGTTTFWVSVDKNGDVSSVRVLMSSGDPQLDAAGMRFLKAMKFTAPQMNGKPMQAAIPIEVRWAPAGTNPQ